MDPRKLRNIDPASFDQRMQSGSQMGTALEDGFSLEEREKLVGLTMVVVGWEIAPSWTAGRDFVTVWALVKNDDGEVRRSKFQDGGRTIPEQCRTLEEAGHHGDIVAVLRVENYEFEDRDTGVMKEASRYWLEDPNAEEPVI